MQQVVSQLLSVAPKITTDMGQPKMDEAVALLDALSHPLPADDIAALMSLLPSDGDDACGLNWTILHSVEASPHWPPWDLLGDRENEWVDTFLIRLENAGIRRS
ncbi:hypothetical protein [Sphingomonas sp. LM7]|uniref:hypothetical protein n=1 Tax=Sphingomonas sp. LM7 TaxID=1938607 RepID=UPI0012376213|nr:hypothetical protein [Sphingomonas sp. LM7]